MPLDPHSEQPGLALPDDYHLDHPTERPEDWGWHAEWGKTSRIAGWIVAVIFVLMMTATHYNLQGALFLGLSAGALVVMLLWDRQRRKNAWRK